MNELTDEKLILNIKQNKSVEQSLNELIKRHSGICVDIINKYISSNYNESLRQELIKEKDYQIYQSALKFDFNKSTKFSTFIGNDMRWKCLNIYNKNKKQNTISVENDLIEHFNFLSEQKKDSDDVFDIILKKTKSHPDKRVGRIFYLRYIVGKNNSVMPWKNISKDLGMSIQGCINIHNSVIKNIKQIIK